MYLKQRFRRNCKPASVIVAHTPVRRAIVDGVAHGNERLDRLVPIAVMPRKVALIIFAVAHVQRVDRPARTRTPSIEHAIHACCRSLHSLTSPYLNPLVSSATW